MPYRTGTLIRFKGSSTKPVCSAGECDRQAADTGFKRKLKAVHTGQKKRAAAQRLRALLAEFGLDALLTSRFALPAESPEAATH